MNPKAKELHQKIEKDFLEIMDNCDSINHKIHRLHDLEFDYSRYISVVQEMNQNSKKMLNFDFDRLALNKK